MAITKQLTEQISVFNPNSATIEYGFYKLNPPLIKSSNFDPATFSIFI